MYLTSNSHRRSFVSRKKTLRHVENMIMMFNNAGFSDNDYLSFRMRLLAQAAIFTMRYFYGRLNNFSITQ